MGTFFQPKYEQAILISQILTNSRFHCIYLCQSDINCRIFDYGPLSRRCRLFEGELETMGDVVFDARRPQSIVGKIRLDSKHFDAYGQPCSSCQQSRYLSCVNGSCQCSPRTYFDGSICKSQKLLGSRCIAPRECRQDLSHTCLPREQCGRKFSFSNESDNIVNSISAQTTQVGIVVAGYGNGSSGSSSDGLNQPFTVDFDSYESMYVADAGNNRIMKYSAGSKLGDSFRQLNFPVYVKVDSSWNIYVSDSGNNRVMLWTKNASSGVIVAGNGTSGSSTNQLQYPLGLEIDSNKNIYIADRLNHRIMLWTVNTTHGMIVAGTGNAGNSSNQLSSPYSLYLNEPQSIIYILDHGNNRVQQYFLNDSTIGITVIAGHGPINSSEQFNLPHSIYVSRMTGDVYIADSGNHRIQLWRKGASTGVTAVGLTGITGTILSRLNFPTCVYLNRNETFMYVCDRGNHRILKFSLI